ncbi:hypothetical protein P609_10720 [Comamonas thiooxydans]|nr:hypothetical protein P609_10720 [Comamonas thiooxydans]
MQYGPSSSLRGEGFNLCQVRYLQVFAELGRQSALTLCDRLCHTLPTIRLQPCDKLLPGPGLRAEAQQFANEI